MRLTCPSCGAEYEAPSSMIPGSGRHVQCSACHTRWFAKGETQPQLSEDQIIARLTSRKGGDTPSQPAEVEQEFPEEEIAAPAGENSLGAVSDELPTPPEEPDPEPEDFDWEEPDPEEILDEKAQEEDATDPTAANLPDEPASRPLQPVPIKFAPDPEVKKAAQRLDVTPGAIPEPDEIPPKSNFGSGLLTAVCIIAAIALIYWFSEDISQAIPMLDPLVGAISGLIDSVRTAIATLIPVEAG